MSNPRPKCRACVQPTNRAMLYASRQPCHAVVQTEQRRSPEPGTSMMILDSLTRGFTRVKVCTDAGSLYPSAISRCVLILPRPPLCSAFVCPRSRITNRISRAAPHPRLQTNKQLSSPGQGRRVQPGRWRAKQRRIAATGSPCLNERVTFRI
ncbi:hypothetical protein VTI28DRAFT_5967 [Corynascus sepedonium]